MTAENTMNDTTAAVAASDAALSRFISELNAPPEVSELLQSLWGKARPDAATALESHEIATRLKAQLGEARDGWEAGRVVRARQALDGYVQKNGVATGPVPALLSRAEAGAGLGISFGGQAAAYFDELAAAYGQSSAAKNLIRTASTRLLETYARLTPAEQAFFDGPPELVKWIEAPATRPNAEFLGATLISQPLIFLTQLANFVQVLESGYAQPAFFKNVRAMVGHSQGVMSALCISETWGTSDLSARAADYAGVMLLQGLRMSQAYLPQALSPQQTQAALEAQAGPPSPMASVTGLTREELAAVTSKLGGEVYLTLDNGRFRQVLSGHPSRLEQLRLELVAQHTKARRAKTAGKLAGRVPNPEWQYLNVGGPFHSPLMAEAGRRYAEDLKAAGFVVRPENLKVAVLDTHTSKNLAQSTDLMGRIVSMQFVEGVSFAGNVRALAQSDVAYVLDFGPTDAVAKLVASNVKGLGIAVVPLATTAGRRLALDTRHAPTLPTRYETWAPRSVQTADGRIFLDNRYTRFTGRSPIILPGMTPTTVDAEIVAAAANAGFVAELAGGGQVTAAMLEKRLDELCEKLTPGEGVVFNALYLDPYLWKLHFESGLIFNLRDRGYPLLGVTVSAGIPPLDEAVELLRRCVAHGLWMNAFKPGNDGQLAEVIAIAEKCPEITFAAHIEGGKAGGHHSWEDLDDLLIRHYDRLRARPNLLLAVGGGIATEAQAADYLTGRWAEKYGLGRMPVDAVFLGTVTMACLEARTSPQVKAALAAAAGHPAIVTDGDVQGGVTSGKSQLDASIYYLENAAARAGRLLDTVVKKPDTIPERRAEIIEALNATAKPYFGDVATMTYEEFLTRFVALSAIGRGGDYEDGRWLDISHRQRFVALAELTQARLSTTTAPALVTLDVAANPEAAVAQLVAAYPNAKTVCVHPEDARAFITICKQPGKPVTFVPVIDGDVRRWFKSDSLWQAQDDRFPADQVLAIPGPEAVAGITQVDEPVADLLGRFESFVTTQVGTPRRVATLSERRLTPGGGHGTGEVACEGDLLRDSAALLTRLSELGNGPVALALVETTVAMKHGRLAPNPLRRLLAPVAGDRVRYQCDHGTLESLELVSQTGERRALIERAGTGLTAKLCARRLEDGGEVSVELGLVLFKTPMGWRLGWDRDGYLGRQAEFYGQLLFGALPTRLEPFTAAQAAVTVTADDIQAFLIATQDDSRGLSTPGLPAQAPLNMAFALGWPSIFSALSSVRPDVMSLLHEDNRVVAGPGWPVVGGDTLVASARLVSTRSTASGQSVAVHAELRRGHTLVATVESTFFIRGPAGRVGDEQDVRAFRAELVLPDAAARELLLAQPWLKGRQPEPLPLGVPLTLDCPEFEATTQGTTRRFGARGSLRAADRMWAVIDLPLTETSGTAEHPVRALAKLLEAPSGLRPLTPPRTLGQKRVRAPLDMARYARASGDKNPLHLSTQVARFAGLDAPIVHGMWTASVAFHRAARLAAGGDGTRLREVSARFVAPVPRGTELMVRARQVAMRSGQRVVQLDVAAVTEQGEQTVLTGEVLVAAPRTAYVFPGQGLQRKGMGMEAYARSRAVREVWDRAEVICRERLGFSLLQVVRENPHELVVQGERLVQPKGVLHLTQFTQVAMTVMAIAQVKELEERGALVRDAVFGGHSVGEYAALTAISDVLPFDAVVEVVYQRGRTMDTLVTRDREGRSPYGMGVIRPRYAGVNEAKAKEIVAEVAQETGLALEIVNFNIRGRQYSVTGHVKALERLSEVLWERCVARHEVKRAYLDVAGIDVPFHSTLLRPGVAAFRTTLERVLPETMPPEMLVGRYLPNLVAEPFSLEQGFVERAFAVSHSPVLEKLLADYELALRDPRRLTRTILIELLAYQFASPVRWIETQDFLFGPDGVEQLVEIGLAEQPVLTNMAQATLDDQRPARAIRVFNSEANNAELLGPPTVVESDAPPTFTVPSTKPAGAFAPLAATATATATPAASPSPAPQPVAARGPQTQDAPPTVAEALRALFALHAKVRPEQLRSTETLDELLGGNSARRNQVLADVAAEFGVAAIDRAYEMPIDELAAKLAAQASGYAAPGKYLAGALEQTLAKALAPSHMGRTDVTDYLASHYSVGPGRIAALLLRVPLDARDGNSLRGGPLSAHPAKVTDRATAETWLAAVVASYEKETGLSLARASENAAGGAAVDPAALQALEARLFGAEGALGRAAKEFARAAGLELNVGAPVAAPSASLPSAERDEAYEQATAPRFDADKHVAFTSHWAWARRDVLALAQSLARGETPAESTLRALARRLDPTAVTAAQALATVAEREGRTTHAETLRAVAKGAPVAARWIPSFQPTAPAMVNGKPTSVPRAGEPDVASFISAVTRPGPQAVSVRGQKTNAAAETYTRALRVMSTEGLSLKGRTALITGASPGSIAFEFAALLLGAGARVVITTSSYAAERLETYKRLYQSRASPGAELHVVPMNQGNSNDIDALVRWLTTAQFETLNGTPRETKPAFLPDLLVPFGALPDVGFVSDHNGKSLAALRVLLLGVERLIARTAEATRAAGARTPCQVILPLSPNHGAFGGDGTYAESKAALETLLVKWSSEHEAWGRDVALCGARIGWVRGTGLMGGNDALAARLETDTGVRTFSTTEMALLLAGLCAEPVRAAASQEPLVADFTAGFSAVPDLAQRVDAIRDELTAAERHQKRRAELEAAFAKATGPGPTPTAAVLPRGRQTIAAPVPTSDDLARLPAVDHLDLTRLVVVVGYGEVGPFGSARTRWALERDGVLSLEAALELAWMTGKVRPSKDGIGFEDSKTGQRIDEFDIKARYEDELVSHVGLRLSEPDVTGWDPNHVVSYLDVHLERDFEFVAPTREVAEELRAADPRNTTVTQGPGQGFTVTRARGTTLRVPRALKIDRNVGGQLPTGWDAARYGISADLAAQLDRTTVMNLIATAEAFAHAGLTPEELYAHLHPARVGSTQSSGIGGMQKLRRLYRDFFNGAERQTDVLQETLINVIAGYVVQSYVGSYGPMSFPVGACATAAVSLGDAADKIVRGEADLLVAGGVDDYGEEGAVGFSDMAATASAETATRLGLSPKHLSRPNDRRRRGFVEAQGAGAIIVCRGSVALTLGLPVHGIVAYAGSFGDGVQRSVPSPGMGALACARETPAGDEVRRNACDFAGRRAKIAEVAAKAASLSATFGAETAAALVRGAQREFGHEFYAGDDRISPLRGALAVFGLDADDIAVVSKHDTSTQANDVNENRLHAALQAALGRTPGLPLAVISQKALTGHPKGAAAAWQLNGLLQAMADDVVPANANLEDVDPAMAEFEPLTFTDAAVPFARGGIRAGLVTSLGFGHVGALVAMVHPFFFWRALTDAQRKTYTLALQDRARVATRTLQTVLSGRAPLFEARTHRPFGGKDGSAQQLAEEARMLTRADARLVDGVFKVPGA